MQVSKIPAGKVSKGKVSGVICLDLIICKSTELTGKFLFTKV